MSNIGAVINFLIDCRLIQGYYTITEEQSYYIVNIQPLGDICKLIVHIHSSLVEHIVLPTYSHCAIHVLPASEYIHASLKLSNMSILECIDNNILLVHMIGINMPRTDCVAYGLRCVQISDSNITSEKQIIEMCSNISTEYITITAYKSDNTCSDILRNIYYHDCESVLDTFGIDYVFCLFYTLKAYNTRIAQTLYIIRESDSAHVIRVKTQ